MKTRRVSRPSLADNWLLLLVGFAVLCWILDSGLRVLLFRESSFLEQALSPDPSDLLGRVLVVCLVTLLGIYAIAALGKAKQAVRAAELARAEADQVFNSMAHAVGVIDLDRKVRRVNDAFSDLTGTGKEEASGRKCFQVLRAPMCDTASCLLRRLLAGEERVEHEWETQLSEGSVARYQVVATALRNHRRELVGMVQHLTRLDQANRPERLERDSSADLAEQRLATSPREWQALVEDVRHRHKDDLQLISNLLDLQCETIRDERGLRALKACRSRIRAITLVYRRLLESEGWSRIDFADYLGRQLACLFQTYDGSLGAITSRISVEQACLEIDMAIPCALIVNELVSNSLKHAFPEGREGEIVMEVSRGPKGEHRLVIGDNGVGFPADLDFRQTETLGLQLVTLLVDQLDGTIELDRRHGTTFRITLFGPRSPQHQR